MKKRFSIQKLAVLGVLAALVFAGNFARVTLPISVGGTTSFTLGNIMCVLSGLLMGPVGGLSAGIGAALYDLTNPLYLSEVPFTFVNKLLMGLAAGLIVRWRGKEDSGYARCMVGAGAGCVVYYVLYFLKSYFYNALLLQGLPGDVAWVALLDKIPASVFNGVLAIVVAPPLCLVIRSALKRAHLKLA